MTEEKINKKIGNKIFIFRESLNMSRVTMAKILDITQQQLSKYENGSNRISAAKLAILSKYFNLDIGYFYGESSPKDSDFPKENKQDLNLLISYYSNIKNSNRKILLKEIAKELTL